MGMFDFMAGQARTPTWDEVQRRRALAEALAGSIGAPTTLGEGLSSIGAALGGVLANRKADRMDAARAVEADNAFEAALAGVPQDNSPLAAALGGTFAAPTNAPPAIADALAPAPAPYSIAPGVAAGAADLYGGIRASLSGTESGGKLTALNNEVGAGGVRGHGGRLQFGAARLKEAADAGVIPLVSPQQFAKMDDATQTAVENWHFADIDNDAKRMGLDRYYGQTIGGVTVTPDAVRAMAHLGGIGGTAKFLNSGGAYNPSDSFGTSLTDYAAKHSQASGGNAPSGAAQAMPGFAPISIPAPPPVNVAMIRAMNNPYLSPEQRQILGGIMAQQQANQITPYQAAQLQMAQQDQAMQAARFGMEMQQATQPQPIKGVEIGDRLVNPQTGEVMADFSSAAPAFRVATPQEAAQYGAQAGQFGPDGRFYPNDPPQGMTIESDGQGGFRMVQGAGVTGSGKPLTEAEGRNTGFLIRAQESNAILGKLGDQGTSLGQRLASNVPVVGNYALSDEYQQFDQAKRDYVNALLRRESGAVISQEEFANADKQYFPQPGDSEAVKAQKAKNREAAIEGLRVGSGRGAEMARPDAEAGLPFSKEQFLALPQVQDAFRKYPALTPDAAWDSYVKSQTSKPAADMTDDDLLKKYGG